MHRKTWQIFLVCVLINIHMFEVFSPIMFLIKLEKYTM